MLWCSDAGADKLPPPTPLDVQIEPQDAITPAGAVSAVIEGMIVVQVTFACDRAALSQLTGLACV